MSTVITWVSGSDVQMFDQIVGGSGASNVLAAITVDTLRLKIAQEGGGSSSDEIDYQELRVLLHRGNVSVVCEGQSIPSSGGATFAAILTALQMPIYNSHSTRVVGGSAALTEMTAMRLKGTGKIIKVYFVPDATSTPASGSNSQVLAATLYTALGASVGAIGTSTIANATPATQWVAGDFGTLTNATFTDGEIVTLKSTLTGTATLPSGLLVIVTQPS